MEEYVCISVLKENRKKAEEIAKKIPECRIKEIHPLGATEYIAIFVPLGVIVLDKIPEVVDLIRDLLSLKEVRVTVDGRTFRDTPDEVIKRIKELPKVVEYLKKHGKADSVTGRKAKRVSEFEKKIDSVIFDDVENDDEEIDAQEK